ncbi:MAG: SUMF1/EgtB/PvdO family nonheme iron enzyme [Candidatus Cloacimonetes bacterium]|nr:SUMF1/EgtB/PvdO family nonheme iron enzyme [Candidatus Cloacimonadota bacterium]
MQTGPVVKNVIPADALVTLNGDGGEKYNSNGKATFRDVPIGSYELTVQAEEHKTHTETFDVSADKTVRKQIILEEGSDVPDNMIFVQGGTFQMGSNDGGSDEKPVHTVTVSDFYIGKTEVTQKEWKEVMGASTSLNNPSYFKGDDLPVENVSWYDAVEFCNKKSEKEGLEKCYSGSGKNTKCDFSKNGYRLPTEAEWEYAARGGVSASLNNRNGGNKYAGSNNVKDVAWYFDNSGSKTHPVGTKQPNELGIYDLSGNVWEWCSDRYDENYYKNSPQNNPQGPSSGKSRVLRGGSWDSGDYCCRFVYRGSYDPDVYFIGFRFVRIP